MSKERDDLVAALRVVVGQIDNGKLENHDVNKAFGALADTLLAFKGRDWSVDHPG